MKTILIPVEPHNRVQSVLELALLLGRKFESYLEGFALRPAMGNLVTMDPVSSLTVVSLRDNDAEIVKQAQGLFELFMRDKGVPRRTRPATRSLMRGAATSPTATISWAITAASSTSSCSAGRAAARRVPRMNTFESALFESGRPVLLAPPTPPRSIGETILVAWNCSTEQARATALAMPLLRKAKRVVVCTVEGATVPGPSGDQIARYLRRNDVVTEAVTVAAGQRRPGEVLLSQAEAFGCDLMIKGAYTQSRLRQMIFGGTTQHVITKAALPVLLAN